MAKKNDKLREWAAHLYIVVGLTQKAIAEQTEMSENTISKWKDEYKWDEERTLITGTPRKIKALLMAELEKVSKGEATKIDADALSKISKALDTLENKISVEIIYDVLKDLDKFTSEEDPQLAIRNLKLHKKFIMHKINADG